MLKKIVTRKKIIEDTLMDNLISGWEVVSLTALRQYFSENKLHRRITELARVVVYSVMVSSPFISSTRDICHSVKDNAPQKTKIKDTTSISQ